MEGGYPKCEVCGKGSLLPLSAGTLTYYAWACSYCGSQIALGAPGNSERISKWVAVMMKNKGRGFPGEKTGGEE